MRQCSIQIFLFSVQTFLTLTFLSFQQNMDCLKLSETLNLFGYNGICISPEKAYILKNSILILQEENHFKKAFYWGRINGMQNDYHIAYGYTKDCLIDQVYYYSFNCVDWLLMPKANKCGRFLAPLAITAFEGDPSIVTNIYSRNPPFPPNEDPAKLFEGPIPKVLKEEDRLASVVELINEEAMIIPRGAWFKQSDGVITENSGFEGLTTTEAVFDKSYLHARPPQQKWKTNLLTRHDYNYAIDFLDPIIIDVPKGCWNLRIEQGDHLAILQSFYWPGMTFYHKINTPHYGALYIGHGKKNLDVPFMI